MAGAPFDFRKPTVIGARMDTGDEQLLPLPQRAEVPVEAVDAREVRKAEDVGIDEVIVTSVTYLRRGSATWCLEAMAAKSFAAASCLS